MAAPRRKLPASLITLAAPGSSPKSKTRWLIASWSGRTRARAAGLGGLRRTACETRSTVQQGPGLFGGAVIDAQAEAGLEQIGRHGQAHASQANEADGFFHGSTLLSISLTAETVLRDSAESRS